jgi:hypothetical protein
VCTVHVMHVMSMVVSLVHNLLKRFMRIFSSSSWIVDVVVVRFQVSFKI